MTEPEVKSPREVARKVDERVQVSEQMLKVLGVLCGVLLAGALAASTTFSALAAQSAKHAAKTAVQQSAANHMTGLQNNQILLKISRAQNNHAQTVQDIRALQQHLDAEIAAALRVAFPGKHIVLTPLHH